MSNVWFCIPSARSDGGTISKWRDAGYKTAIWRDPGSPLIDSNITIRAQYQGYAVACNALIKLVLDSDPACDWVVCGGDDVFPDPDSTPELVVRECATWFGMTAHPGVLPVPDSTFGVMQPTGDRWGANHIGPWPRGSAYIDRVCGSPWIGREFCRRVYGGNGPWWHEYRHMFVDEELQNVAQKLGVLWQRPDLTHMHLHWGREGDPLNRPAFLEEVNSARHWEFSKALFQRRKAAGFPGAFDLASGGIVESVPYLVGI